MNDPFPLYSSLFPRFSQIERQDRLQDIVFEFPEFLKQFESSTNLVVDAAKSSECFGHIW